MRYAFVAEHRQQFSVRTMCRCLRIHPSGFYAWLKNPLSQRAQEDIRQTRLIEDAWKQSGRVYGYRKLHDELPYDSAVRPESYTHRKDGSVEIHQQIVVARDSQKAIVLGKKGAMIKAIGEAARKELAELLECKVHLFLHVKVEEGWADSRDLYEEIGLEWVR